MTHQDDDGPAERAQRMRDSAEQQIQGLAGKSMLTERITASATVASAKAQIAIADAILAVAGELREGRRQDARQARREARGG